MKRIIRFAAWPTLAVALAVVSIGCGVGSGGEFRAEELPTKADLQKQIDDVKANTAIAPGAKSMIIAGLTRKLDRAK